MENLEHPPANASSALRCWIISLLLNRGWVTLRCGKNFPLEMVSSKNDDSMNSTFGNRDAVDKQTSYLYISTEDAERRGIRTGDLVRTFNERGSLLLTAEVDGVVGRGVVRVPAVRWANKAQDRRSVNVLTSQRLTDIGGGPAFYSCLVEVEKCGD